MVTEFIRIAIIIILVAILTLLTFCLRKLVLKLAAYRRNEITMKHMIFIFVLNILVLVLSLKIIIPIPQLFSRPVLQNEGFFPLYEMNYSKTISIDHHPFWLHFALYIETSYPLNLKWDDVVLKLEAIKDGQVIGTHLMHGSFDNVSRLEPGLINRYTIVEVTTDKEIMRNSKSIVAAREEGIPIDSKTTVDSYNNTGLAGKVNVSYFNFGEPAVYRLTVVQPCEKYEYVVTELRTTGFY